MNAYVAASPSSTSGIQRWVARVSPTTRTLIVVFVVAIAIRLAVMAFLYPDQLSPERDHWRFGYETGRIARSIVEGHGFSNPLFAETGPSAMLPPVYPCIIAAFFWLFGVYTKAAAIAILSFQAIVSAVTCVPVYSIARRTFGDRAAKIAAWGWALLTYAIYFPLARIWGTWLATLLLSCIVLMTLRLAESSTKRAWLLYGVLWGVAALTEPMVLAVAPPFGLWLLYQRRDATNFSPTRHVGKSTAILLSSVAFVAVVTPWFVRNYRDFHQVVPFRDGFGLSLILGTKADTVHWATYSVGVGPWHNDSEWRQYQTLGEINYFKRLQQKAFGSIRHHTRWFVVRSLRRVVYIWTGFWSLDRSYLAEEPLDLPNIPLCTALTALALWGLFRAFRSDPRIGILYASIIVFFPLIYYTTSPEDYYRRPLDPILVILAASVLVARQPAEEPGREQLVLEASSSQGVEGFV